MPAHLEHRHAEMQRSREGQHRPFTDLGKVGHAECQGDQRADHHGQQDRQARDGGAADEKRGGDQQADIGRRQTGRLADDQGHCDDAAVHGQYVLQAVEQIGAEAKVFVLGALGGGGHGKLFAVVLVRSMQIFC